MSVSLIHPFPIVLRRLLPHQLLFAHFLLRRRTICQVSWLQPYPNSLKVNVDGSALSAPGPSGVGFVIRDLASFFVAAQCQYFQIGTSFRAELLALLHTLDFYLQCGYSNLIFDLDSKVLVDMLQTTFPPWQLHYSLQKKGL